MSRAGLLGEIRETSLHWSDSQSWILAPVLLRGDLLQSNLRYELIVGLTRLGNLLGALDRQGRPGHARQVG
jgi:hypothetical protein